MLRLQHLPAIIIHGRWDAICLPQMAYLLHQAWKKSDLWIIPSGGHSSNDPAIASALATAGDLFMQRLRGSL